MQSFESAAVAFWPGLNTILVFPSEIGHRGSIQVAPVALGKNVISAKVGVPPRPDHNVYSCLPLAVALDPSKAKVAWESQFKVFGLFIYCISNNAMSTK